MEAKELRFGNYVIGSKNAFSNIYKKELICNIQRIDCDSDLGIKLYHSENPIYILDSINNIKPIPLTEEWLIKFGLQHKSFSFDHECLHKDINVGYNGDDFINNQMSFLYKKKVWFKIHYVHELQNLYFALTKQELTIKK